MVEERQGGAMGMQAEDIKGWIWGIEQEEEEEDSRGTGNCRTRKWRCLFVRLIQTVWRH